MVFRQSQVLALVNFVAVLLCAIAFTWSYHRHPFLDAFESSLRRAYSASEIQSWATEVLGAVKENKVIKRSEYPQWATDNRFPASRRYIRREQRSGWDGGLRQDFVGEWGDWSVGSDSWSTGIDYTGKDMVTGSLLFCLSNPIRLARVIGEIRDEQLARKLV